jgi:hypothetical protein
LAKFKGNQPWKADDSRATDEVVKACLEGKVGVEEILSQEIMSDRDTLGELESVLQTRGNAAFERKFCQKADKVYRAVHGRFSRRGAKMPTPPRGWRQRCLKEISDHLERQKKIKDISQNLRGRFRRYGIIP